MRVKIGNEYYDSNEDPIMVILDSVEVDNITNMIGTKYCSYPNEPEYTDNDYEKIKLWMKE